MYRVRSSRALQRLLFLCILIAQSRAGLAQTISNPVLVDFDPSPDHFTLAADGTPVVSEYKMSVYVVGQPTAVKTVSLGKPDLQAEDNKIRLDFMTLMAGFASPGVVYEARVAASGPGGVVSSSSSNQFVYTACPTSLSAPAMTVDANGGNMTVTVATDPGCRWTATSSVIWAGFTTSWNNYGPGTIGLSIAPNNTQTGRTTTMTIAGRPFNVTQAGAACQYLLSGQGFPSPAAGTSAALTVASPVGCPWTATSNDPWIVVTAGATGSGDGGVTIVTILNPTSQPRTGSATVAGKTVTITQDPLVCNYAIGVGSLPVPIGLGVSGAQTYTWSGSTTDVRGLLHGTGDRVMSAWYSGSSLTIDVTIPAGQAQQVAMYLADFDGSGRSEKIEVLDTNGAVLDSRTVADFSGGRHLVWTVQGHVKIQVTRLSGPNAVVSGILLAPATFDASRSGGAASFVKVDDTTKGSWVGVYGATGHSFAADEDVQAMSSTGGAGTLMVTAPTGCPWTATSNAPWLTLTSNASGSGSATVGLSAAANTGSAREATVTVGGKSLILTQLAGTPACPLTLTPTGLNPPQAGGTGSVAVATSSCNWTASSDAAWLTVTSGGSGSGAGTVSFSVAPNPTPAPRTATLTVGGQNLVVAQPGINCGFSLASTSRLLGSAASTGSVALTAAAGCAWTASSSAAWLTLTSPASASGSGTVTFAVAANTGSMARTGILTIAGQTFTVTQDVGPCNYTIGTPNLPVPAKVTIGGAMTYVWADTTGDPRALQRAMADRVMAAWYGGTITIDVQIAVGQAQQVAVYAADYDPWGRQQTFEVRDENGALLDTRTIADFAGGQYVVWTMRGHATIRVTATAGPNAVVSGVFLAPASAAGLPSGSSTAAAFSTIDTTTQGGWKGKYGANGYTLAADETTNWVTANGGPGTVSVTAPNTCAWTATSDAPWVTFTTANGSGSGTAAFDIAPATSTSDRTATLTIAGQTFTLTQVALSATPCTFTLSATAQSAPASGMSGTITVTSSGGCAWTAASNAAWLTVTSGASGTGTGTVGITAAPNTTGSPRVGTVTIAGQTLTITQAVPPCSYVISTTAQSVTAAAGTGAVTVTAASGCAWTATSSAAWLTVTAGATGTGTGAVSYSIAANTTPTARTATLTIAGQTVTVTQAGVPCTYTLSATVQSFAAAAATGSVAVTAPAGCAWTAASSASWLTVTAGASGAGNGAVTYSAAANTSTAARSATLTIAGQTVTVNQAGVPCTLHPLDDGTVVPRGLRDRVGVGDGAPGCSVDRRKQRELVDGDVGREWQRQWQRRLQRRRECRRPQPVRRR